MELLSWQAKEASENHTQMSTKSPTQQETLVTKAAEGFSYYYIFNPLTKERKYFDQLNDFNEACRIASSTPGIWEVHVVRQNNGNKR